jgi:hypothetical protein
LSNRFYSDRAGTLNWIKANVVKGDGGTTATLKVYKNGVLVNTATVAAAGYLGSQVADTTAFVAGDYFQVEIVGAGGTAGPIRAYINFTV